jgi:hypothetical protein
MRGAVARETLGFACSAQPTLAEAVEKEMNMSKKNIGSSFDEFPAARP